MKLSIITINYNNSEGLKKTVESVVHQTWRNFEYIVIDGGSNDESLKIIKDNENNIDYWVSEPDKGIYNALNKGILAANGEYLLMLNSGDYLINQTILSDLFDKYDFNEEIVYGNIYRESNGVIFSEGIQPRKLTFNYFRSSMINHQSIFIKRTLHEKIGLYDENMKFVADWKFLILAICKHNVVYSHIDIAFSVYDVDGISSQYMYTKMKDEKELFFEKEFLAFKEDYEYLDSIIRNKLINRVKEISNKLYFNSKEIIKKIIPTHWYK